MAWAPAAHCSHGNFFSFFFPQTVPNKKDLSKVRFWKKFHGQTSDHAWSFRSSPFKLVSTRRAEKNKFENVWRNLAEFLNAERRRVLRPDKACQKRFSWFSGWIQKMQKCVNLVDLVKSFQTIAIQTSIYYLFANVAVDTAENGPLKVCQKLETKLEKNIGLERTCAAGACAAAFACAARPFRADARAAALPRGRRSPWLRDCFE